MTLLSAFSKERQRAIAGGIVTTIGVLLFGPPVYDIWDDYSVLDWSLFTTFAENVTFLFLAGGIVAGGVWLLRTDWDPQHTFDVAKWTITGFGVAIVLFSWVVFVQLSTMNSLKPYVIAMDGVVIVTAVAFGLGIMSAKSNIQQLEFKREQRTKESLEALQQTVLDLQQATAHEEAYDVGLDGVEAMIAPEIARLYIDQEIVRERTDASTSNDTASVTTVDVGTRGEFEIVAHDVTTADRKTLELLGTHLDRALSRIEREQNLESERERLALINRILRHNLLNSLNVVQARTELIDEYLDSEADTHLETIRARTDDMINLVGKLRTLMDALVESDESEFQEVDLETTLREEIERAERTFEGATFELEDDLSDAGTVIADELLGEVFENLLVNAVQHNDKDTPRVTISVDRDEEMTTVRIADNGPGISPELREQLFQRGEKQFESTGTGFGLALVQEVVEAYGGSISLVDNESEGAAFSVLLPSDGT